MKIIAHRGKWLNVSDKNTLGALICALDSGFGVETDIRDFEGELVISHDLANKSSCPLTLFFSEYKKRNCTNYLALNVKADGIQQKLKELLKKYDIQNYFLFDMSTPEYVVNVSQKLTCFTRKSDIEDYVMFDKAAGVWLDYFFNSDFIKKELITYCLSNGKKVCIVSPELHGLEYATFWRYLKNNDCTSDDILFCTDKPDEAEVFFNDKN